MSIKKLTCFIITLFILFFNLSTHAKLNIPTLGGAKKYPTVDEAFTLSATSKKNNQIKLKVNAIPGTYVYQNLFKFETDNNQVSLQEIEYPKGEIITDEHYGKTTVFRDEFEVTIPILTQTEQEFELIVHYQGCLEGVLCYPPTKQSFLLTSYPSKLNKSEQVATTSINQEQTGQIVSQKKNQPILTASPIKSVQEQNDAFNLLKDASFVWIIIGFFIFGLALSLTPCVLPMLPIISGIIAGHKHKITKRHAFELSLVYVLSMAFTYMLAGVLVASFQFDVTASLQNPIIIIIVSIIFVLLALSSFGFYELKLPDAISQKLANAQHHQKGGTFLGVAIMGVLAALVVSPCATAPLTGALIYISSTGNAILGGAALFSMGFAMGVPILMFGTSAGHFLPKAGPWMKEINIFFGVVFIGMTIFLLSRIISGPMTLVLWSLLLIFYAVHLGLLEPAQHGWQRIQKGFALVIAIYGAFLLAGATQHQSDVFHPFGIKTVSIVNPDEITGEPINIQPLNYTTINNLNELQENLKQAKQKNQITMVDFYADWCGICKTIEKNVFADQNVKRALDGFKIIKVDVTNNTEEDKLIKNQLSVYGPPTIIFFDKNGDEIKDSRIVGEIDAGSFYELITNL